MKILIARNTVTINDSKTFFSSFVMLNFYTLLLKNPANFQILL